MDDEPTQHRGRAALKRRVKPLKRNRASAPVDVFLNTTSSRANATTTGGAPCLASLARRWIPHPIPLRTWEAPRPGRPRLQSRRKLLLGNCHEPTQHRGRAALQRRVKRPKRRRASAPVDVRSRAPCCETLDSTPHPSEDLGSATTGKATTSVAQQAAFEQLSQTHAAPWKSGASAPRKAPQKKAGFSPSGRPFPRPMLRDAASREARMVQASEDLLKSCHSEPGRKPGQESAVQPTPPRQGVPHVSRSLRDVGFHNSIPLKIWQALRPRRSGPSRAGKPPRKCLVIPNRAESPVRNLL